MDFVCVCVCLIKKVERESYFLEIYNKQIKKYINLII